MSRTRRMLGGAVISYVHQAAVIALGLWLTPFLLHRVGQLNLGLWLVANQVLAYLALMDLGVLQILPREIAFASGDHVNGDPAARIALLVARVRSIVRWQMVALSVTAIGIWYFLPDEWQGLKGPLAVVFVAFVLFYPARLSIAVLQGLQELSFIAKTQMAGWVVGTVLTVGLVIAGSGLYALTLGWAATICVPALAAMWRVRGRWPNQPAGEPERVRQYFARSIWVSVGQIAQVLLNGSDILLLGKLLGPLAVVPYSCTGKLVTVFANHPQLLMHAAQPALSELRAAASRDRLASVGTALTMAMLTMSGALAVVILPANEYFVTWWVGPDQFSGWPLTLALVAMMLLRHWNIATVYTLFCFGYERQLSTSSIVDGVVTIVATTLLVWTWGPIGAPLGSIVGVSLVTLPLNVRSVTRELGMTPAAFLRRLLPLSSRITVMALGAGAAALWLHGRSFVAVGAVTLALALIYAAVVLPLVWNGPIGPYLRIAADPFTRWLATRRLAMTQRRTGNV